MSWFQSIVISILTGALGLVCGGLIMNACVGWYRVSSFEGKAGYAVVAVALLGGIAGMLLGLVVARMVAGGADPGFLKGVGYGGGTVLAVAALAALVCRLGADLAPTLDGHEIEVAFEVRCPERFPAPEGLDADSVWVGVYLPGGRSLPQGQLRLDGARQEAGHWILPGTAPLTTSASRKFFRARFDAAHDALFALPLRAHPNGNDREWSAWVVSGWDVGTAEPPPAERFNLRYRVQVVEPPPPEPDPESVDAATFAALGADDALDAWLSLLTPDAPEERTRAILSVVAARPAELAALIRSTDAATREPAIVAVRQLSAIDPDVARAVRHEGRELAAALRRFNAMPADDPGFLQVQVDLRSRFNTWKPAWWTVFQQLGEDGRPPIQEMHDLAQARAEGTSMGEIVLNARVMLDALAPAAAPKP